jgi:alpha-mannosidase
LLSIDNPAVILSALKHHQADTSWVIRVYSTSARPELCRLQVPLTKTRACITDLHEEWNESMSFAIEAGTITLEIPHHRIVTLLVR